MTIFCANAAYPRICGSCGHVVRSSRDAGFVGRVVPLDEDDEAEGSFSLELGVAEDLAPF